MSTSRRWALLAAGAAGLVVGVAATFALTTPTVSPPADAASPTTTTTAASSSVPDPPEPEATDAPGSSTTTEAPSTEPPPPADDVLLVWTAGGLPAGVGAQIAALDGVEAVTMVQGGQADLIRSIDAGGTAVDALVDNWRIPLDTIAVDPATMAPFLPGPAARAVEQLEPGESLLTESSAELRRIGAGATLDLYGAGLRVDGVIDDHSGAGAELVVHLADAAALGVARDRYLLVRHDGRREQLQLAIAGGPLSGRTIRFRSPAETEFLRHGDAVAPQVLVKRTFGEFSYRPGADRSIEMHPDWVDRWIVAADVPVLGQITCHRRLVPRLRTAMHELELANLTHLVDPADFAGCWSPRRIAAGEPISRHAWGIAVDLNVDGNPRGDFSTQDPRLVEAMRAAGFIWGGTWLVPDPAHYEAVP